MRKAAALAALTMTAGMLAGCSGTEAYCDSLKDNQNVAKQNNPNVADAVAKMKEIRDKAPSDVKDDWDVMVSFMEKTEKVKTDPGKAGDLAAESAKLQEAYTAIEKHAKDECGLTLPR